MAGNLHVRNLDDELIARLKRRAARHGRSTEAEHREILRQALAAEIEPSFDTLAAELRNLTKRRKQTPSAPGTRRAVSAFVVDASIAVKWVIEDDGTPQALTLRRQAKLIAPDLLMAECANILWKKVQRDELSKEGALLAARLLQAAEIELLPTRSSMEAATHIAIELDQPAYDCVYLALAIDNGCKFVTADERLLRKLHQGRRQTLGARAISLTQAAKL